MLLLARRDAFLKLKPSRRRKRHRVSQDTVAWKFMILHGQSKGLASSIFESTLAYQSALLLPSFGPLPVRRRVSCPFALRTSVERREANFAVTIAGGSIDGLCAVVTLRGIGAKVHIYERVTSSMETRGARIVVQGDFVHLPRQHQAPDLPMTACRVRRYFDPDGGAGTTQAMPQQYTSWEAIYKTPRAT
jgi:hypothetical protein